MRTIILDTPCPEEKRTPRLARLTRHLEARLLDFGPGGPEVIRTEPAEGYVLARFPDHDTAQVLAGLAGQGIHAAAEKDRAVFYLAPDVRFEDLDHVWGCLFALL